MAYSGIALPPRVQDGRLVTESGSDQTRKVIGLAIADGESDNPFIELGLQAPVFDLNAAPAAALVRRRIQQHFAKFLEDGRARLVDVTTRNEGVELWITVTYRDLETGETKAVTQPLSEGS